MNSESTITEKRKKLHDLSKSDVRKTSIEDLLSYHQAQDGKLPLDSRKIPGSLLLKFAARFGEEKKALIVAIEHSCFATSLNQYQPKMYLADSSEIDILPFNIFVGKKSIGINGFVALKVDAWKML